MSKNIIAFCSDIPEFHLNRILDSNWISKFPGAYWIYSLSIKFSESDIDFFSGDIVLEKIKNGHINANDVFIIQDSNSYHGYQLINKGCSPFLITCLESPLYAYNFYDNVNKVSRNFRVRILFDGLLKKLSPNSGINEVLKFPTYGSHQLNRVMINWETKKLLVLVASNKHFNIDFKIPNFDKWIYYLYWLREILLRVLSKSRRDAKKVELLSLRREYVKYFSAINCLDIFGNGWEEYFKLNNLPVVSIKGKCEDKIEAISSYKFALCFENVRYDGYVTEKVLDCFIAGVIPIYLGADNITEFIPKDAFIDARNFKSFKDLEIFITNLSERDASVYLKAADMFLKKDPSFSFEAFSDKIFNYFISNYVK